VFIVDDDASVRDGLAWLLRSRHLPSEAFDSAEAFDAMNCRPALRRASPAACCWTCACPA
jgi:two-component system response regulator DctR